MTAGKGDQLLMAAALGDVAVLYHHDAIGIADGGKTVGDHEGGATLEQYLQRLLDQYFSVRVNRGGGLVQNKDLSGAPLPGRPCAGTVEAIRPFTGWFLLRLPLQGFCRLHFNRLGGFIQLQKA